jgi:hypothetical protein
MPGSTHPLLFANTMLFVGQINRCMIVVLWWAWQTITIACVLALVLLEYHKMRTTIVLCRPVSQRLRQFRY